MGIILGHYRVTSLSQFAGTFLFSALKSHILGNPSVLSTWGQLTTLKQADIKGECGWIGFQLGGNSVTHIFKYAEILNFNIMITAKNGQRDLSVAQLVHSLNCFYNELPKTCILIMSLHCITRLHIYFRINPNSCK